MGHNKVYDNIQPVTEPDNVFRKNVDLSTNRRLKFKGEDSFYESDIITFTNEKLSNYKMVLGTDRSLYGLLAKNKEIFPNGPYFMDSRDDGITIHNHNFDQSPKYVYTYHGGNGELLVCNISSQKKTQSVQAEQSSTIDPLTKEVKTSVVQSCNSEEDTHSKEDGEFQKGLWSKLTHQRDPKEVEREALISSAKDEKTTKEELQSTYKVTKEDIENYVGDLKTQFKDLYENAKNTGDIIPLVKANSMKKGVIKVKRRIKTTVDPAEYSQLQYHDVRTHTPGNSQSDQSMYNYKWHSGINYLKNNSNIIFLGYDNENKIPKGLTIGYNSFPRARVIMEKEIELELDGARILSSPLTAEIQEPLSLNDISDKTQKIIKMDLKVLGRPGLVSSLIVFIRNISKRYSGEWYTKKVTHRINTSGYTCSAELIKKASLVVISNTTSKVDTKSIYSSLHKVASDRLKNVDIYDEAAVRQAFHEYIKKNNVKDKSLVLDLNSPNPDGSFNIHPATDDQVNITREREKHRL